VCLPVSFLTVVRPVLTEVKKLTSDPVSFFSDGLVRPGDWRYDSPVFQEFEGDGVYLIERANLDPDGPVNTRTLCFRLTGHPPLRAPRHRMRSEAELVMVHGKPRIYVREGTLPARARWLACHELAHWWLRESRQEDPLRLEMQCDVLGAILCAPGRAVSRAVREAGRDPIRIAELLKTTQSLALLRLGETGHVPSALVEVRRSLLRGEAYRWPTKAQLRRALRQEIDGLKRVRITDERKRVGLLAEG